MRRSSTFTFSATVILAALSLQAAAQKVYWTDTSNLRRSNLDGSQAQTLKSGFIDITYIAADPIAGALYYAYGETTPMIFRSDLGGNQVQPLLRFDRHHFVRGLAIDRAGGKIYWASSEGDSGGTGTIRRANLDGSGLEDVVPNLDYPYGPVLDVIAGKMYWIHNGTHKIQRANLDGSNVEDVASVDQSDLVTSLALDPLGQKIYWADSNPGQIKRANLDGSGVEQYQPVSDFSLDAGMAIDLASRSLFWCDTFNQKIYRGNLDGAPNATPIADDNAMSITLTPEPSTAAIVMFVVFVASRVAGRRGRSFRIA